jgi:DNA-binding transcriptional LysR family regulator
MSLLSPELQAFMMIVRDGTVLQAAKSLGLTQTGVTQRLKRLESLLGTTVFIRSRSGMTLTEEGKSLLQYCQATLELEGEAFAKIQSPGKGRVIRLTLSGPSSILRARVIPACAEVRKTFPDLRFQFDLLDHESCVVKLRSGISQIAVLSRSEVSPEMDSKLLAKEKYRLAVPYAWRERKIQDVVQNESIIDFDESDEMTHHYLRKFDLLQVARQERHFANNTDALTSLIAAEAGYSVLTDEFAEPFIARKEIAWLKPHWSYENELALAWYPRPQMPTYFKEVIRAIR